MSKLDDRDLPLDVLPDIEPQTPDEVLDDLEAGEAAPDLEVSLGDDPPPLGRGWAFDFAAGRFIEIRGGPLQTYGRETLRFWIEKCLRTPRTAYPIYPDDFGVEDPNEFIGQPVASLSAGYVAQQVREALTVHPRISDVTDVSLSSSPADDAALVSFTVVLDDESELDFNLSLGG